MLSKVSRALGLALVITSGADGEHTGPLDPHKFGKAFDVRSHDFTAEQKNEVLTSVMKELGEIRPAIGGGYITEFFFGWLEAEGKPNEHFHFQLRHDLEYKEA